MDQVLDEEVYTVDVDAQKELVLCGGKENAYTVVSLGTGDVLFRMEGYSDSVVFSRFVNGGVVIATLNGEVYSYGQDYVERARFELQEDISFIELQDETLYVAGSRGYALDLDLDIKREFFGHRSIIRHMLVAEDRVYTSSQDQIIIYKEASMSQIPVKCGGVMYVNKNALLCAQIDKRLVGIFFQGRKLKEIAVDGRVEAIKALGNIFFLGGDFGYLLLINTKDNFGMTKVDITGGISQIKAVDSILIFSTFDGKVGHLGAGGSCQLVETSVGVVFDLYTDGHTIVTGGEYGIDVFSLQHVLENQQSAS